MPSHQAEPTPLPASIRRVVAKVSTEVGATPKQHAFAELRLSGLSQAESYRRAYDTSSKDNDFVAQSAHFVARNPKVESMLIEGRAALNHLRASRASEWKEALDEYLWETVHNKELNPKDRLQAAKLGGSLAHVQAYAKAVDASDAAIANLKDAVSSFFSAASSTGVTIDADFEPLTKSLETWQPVDSIESTPLSDPYDELDAHGNQAFKRLSDDDDVLQL